ncbi:MAG: hypothetical protein RBQ97_05285 [Acholeplasma sp.]|nr:hypothetical protein [Acholeplasma sp.]
MKKIDLHIHTVVTGKDARFVFSLDKLSEYVSDKKIDAIAITNHNCFDKAQFEQIVSKLSCLVFPGVEIDIESGHLLLIAKPNSDLTEFSSKCIQLEHLNVDVKSSISFEELIRIFSDLSEYLLIPHYKKDPALSDETIEKFGNNIFAGEVSNPKKFTVQLKSENPLVPVIFSDIRICDELTSFPFKQTYVQLDEITLNSLKYALRDKSKVSLSEEHSSLFQILDDGTLASDGLNVIFGKRSSGKSYTLKKIFKSFSNTKHIAQFSLLEPDERKAERDFKEKINLRQSNSSDEYLEEFRSVANEILDIDLDENEKALEDYISSLKSFASHTYEADVYAKTSIYNESNFNVVKDVELEELAAAVQKLLETTKHKTLIREYIEDDSLVKLYLEFAHMIDHQNYDLTIKEKVNSIVVDLKRLLQNKSSVPQIEDCDFVKTFMDRVKVERFKSIVQMIKIEKLIYSEKKYGYNIEVKCRGINTATELKDISGRSSGDFRGQMTLYNEPYRYLHALREKLSTQNSEAYKYFCLIDYKVKNDYGFDVSGGERAEFNLISELRDSFKYDMVLIDEPESSFDNIFLRNNVNQIIKDLSNKLPVFVVTHSNTVGASIKPDYILYTERVIDKTSRKVDFKLYGGYASDRMLKSASGEEVNNYTILVDSLEAGEEAYKERGTMYENIKNRG